MRAVRRITPKVHIKQDSWDDMMHITSLVDKEVGWFAQVERDGYNFTVGQVYLPTQQSSGATVEFEPDMLADFAVEMMNVLTPEEFGAFNNSLRCWGHSHGSGGVSPSGQDQSTIEKLIEVCPYFVALRTNRSGNVQADVGIAELGLVFEDVDVTAGEIDEQRRAFWETQVKERVKPIVYQSKGKGKDSLVPYDKRAWDGYYDYTRGDSYGSGSGKSSSTHGTALPVGVVSMLGPSIPIAELKGDDPLTKDIALAFNRLTNLTDGERHRLVRAWWDACDRVWGLTTAAYIKANNLTEAHKELSLLGLASHAALGEKDAQIVEGLMDFFDFESPDEVFRAGFQPTGETWYTVIRRRQDNLTAEKMKDKVLNG